MDKLHRKIREYISKLGLDPSLIGCVYFKLVIEIYVTETSQISLANACERIARMYSRSCSAVQRALYYAINGAKDKAIAWLKQFDSTTDAATFHPKLLICCVANHIIDDLDNFND